MNKRTDLNERGQALVMIALAIVVIFAFTALTIDGTSVFSDRRHSQNASDTAVLAAAIAKVQDESQGITADWQQAGLNRAADNGYSTNGTETVVNVQLCSTAISIDGKTFNCKGLPTNPAPDPSEYVHIVIKSTVHLKFAPILGWKTLVNYTEAVSRATPTVPTSWFDGYGIASVGDNCAPNAPYPFELGGNAVTLVNGAGVLVNASCPNSFVQKGTSSSLDTTTGVCVHGGATYNSGDITADPGVPPVTTGCAQVDPATYQMPAEPSCQNNGSITEVPKGSGVWVATPGNFNTTFPDVQGGQATIKITKGVYCLNKGISVGSGWTMTTDTNGNNVHDPATEGALFYVPGPHNSITFNGNGFVNLHAISQNPPTNFSPYWLNLLIYVPPTNDCQTQGIKLTGGSGSTFTGTVLATACDVTLAGTSDNAGGTVTLDSQIISNTVKTTGSNNLTIVYNQNNNATTITNPGIALIQ